MTKAMTKFLFLFGVVAWAMIVFHAALYCTTIVDSPYTFSILHLLELVLSPLLLVESMRIVARNMR